MGNRGSGPVTGRDRPALDGGAPRPHPAHMLELFKRTWAGWNVAVRGIVGAQNAVLMTVAYVFGIGPVALVMRVTGRSLLDRAPADPSAASHWRPRRSRSSDMHEASRMF